MDGNSRATMRILSDRPNHAGHCAAQREQESERPGHRHGNGQQPVPLRDVPAHSRGHSPGCEGVGMRLVQNVSRRRFLKGAVASGVFVLSARIVPKQLWAAEGTEAEGFDPGVWMSIAADGKVTIIAHRSEMG